MHTGSASHAIATARAIKWSVKFQAHGCLRRRNYIPQVSPLTSNDSVRLLTRAMQQLRAVRAPRR